MTILPGMILLCMLHVGYPGGFIKDVYTKIHYIFEQDGQSNAFVEHSLKDNEYFKATSPEESFFRVYDVSDLKRKNFMDCKERIK